MHTLSTITVIESKYFRHLIAKHSETLHPCIYIKAPTWRYRGHRDLECDQSVSTTHRLLIGLASPKDPNRDFIPFPFLLLLPCAADPTDDTLSIVPAPSSVLICVSSVIWSARAKQGYAQFTDRSSDKTLALAPRETSIIKSSWVFLI